MKLRASLDDFLESSSILEEGFLEVESALGTSRNAVDVAAGIIGETVADAHKAGCLSEYQAMELCSTISKMTTAAGQCESIGMYALPSYDWLPL
jgi:predicted membrane chloride channel (bestrophin family)